MTLQANRLSIKKNDMVQVIAGREKGKTGKVTQVYPNEFKLKIERVNLVKRHVKPSQKHPQGGVIEKELPIHYSNVQIFCTKCNRGVRHGFKHEDHAAGAKKTAKATKSAAKDTGAKKQKKIRVCKRCGTSVEAQVAG